MVTSGLIAGIGSMVVGAGLVVMAPIITVIICIVYVKRAYSVDKEIATLYNKINNKEVTAMTGGEKMGGE